MMYVHSSEVEQLGVALREELASVAVQHDAKHQENALKHRTALDEVEAGLKHDIAKLAKDQDEKHCKGRHSVTAANEAWLSLI